MLIVFSFMQVLSENNPSKRLRGKARENNRERLRREEEVALQSDHLKDNGRRSYWN
jgi:hypothetical protein